MDVDARQGLADVIVQFATDAFALLFLRQEDLVGELAQLLFHVARLRQ